MSVVIESIIKAHAQRAKRQVAQHLPNTMDKQMATQVTTIPMKGKTSHVWADFPYMGSLPIYGRSSHVWEVFPCMEYFPYVEKLHIYCKPQSGNIQSPIPYHHCVMSNLAAFGEQGKNAAGLRHNENLPVDLWLTKACSNCGPGKYPPSWSLLTKSAFTSSASTGKTNSHDSRFSSATYLLCRPALSRSSTRQ
mmetsp:Transcript_128115/g.410699  ORF Transcript_128115/g.410699 Transcript_128115/m.410699 type:complete len:193 (-) Transcript_128115:860-1438(-)